MALKTNSSLHKNPCPLHRVTEHKESWLGPPQITDAPTCPVLDAQGCQAGHQPRCQKRHQHYQPLLHRGPSCPAPLAAPGAAEVHLQGRSQEGPRDHETRAPLPQEEGAPRQAQTLGRHQAAHRLRGGPVPTEFALIQEGATALASSFNLLSDIRASSSTQAGFCFCSYHYNYENPFFVLKYYAHSYSDVLCAKDLKML